MRLRALVLPLLLAAATACSPHHLAGEATLAGLDDEELCGRRSNLLNGALMVRELARRGVDCAPFDEAALNRGFHLWFLTRAPAPAPAWAGPSPGPGSVGLEPVAAARPEPLPAPADRTGSLAAAAVAWPDPLPPEPAPAAPASALTEPPAPARRTAAPSSPRPPAVAPLVTPACAARSVRTAGEEDGPAAPVPGRWAVAFRNACGFPIRVLYAQRPGGALSGATGLLQPGETSAPAPIEDGFRQPGYVVCSYETAPGEAPCRLAGGAR